MARINPIEFSPSGPISPGDNPKGPNKKFIPFFEKESNFITAVFNQLNIEIPAGILKIIKANNN
jgi:hypothetical protein